MLSLMGLSFSGIIFSAVRTDTYKYSILFLLHDMNFYGEWL